MKKIIKNILPYNDPQKYTEGTEYVSCFFSALFALVVSNGKEVLPYISNNIFYYGYNPKESDLRFKYGIQIIMQKSLEEINAEQGIFFSGMRIPDCQIVQYIENKIDKEMPVCVGVDLFDLSYRKDRYHKIHTPHSLLVYGYDKGKQRFNILDNLNNAEYSETFCSYADLYSAYTNCLNIISQSVVYTFEIDKNKINEKFNVIDYRNEFIENLLSNKTIIFENLECLKELYKEIKIILLSKEYLVNKGMELFNLIHYQILNIRKAELYTFYRMLGVEQIINEFKQIIFQWVKVRNYMYRYITAENVNKEKVEVICEHIKIVYKIEYKFYVKLFDSLST